MKPGSHASKIIHQLSAFDVLFAILLLAFCVRMLPVLMFQVPAGLDSYLHIDIALRIVENGGLLSLDPMSLVGLKAYSYPPGFHALLAAFIAFLPPVAGSHLLAALIGTATTFIVFFLSRDIFADERAAIFSAFFMATSPIHILRTSMPIPEAFGVLLFTACLLTLIKYFKTRDIRFIAATAVIFIIYMFSHRGWTLFVLTSFLLLLVYRVDAFKRKRYLAGLSVFVAAAYFAVTSNFSDLLARINVEPVSAIGYFKWMGGAHLMLLFAGIVMMRRTKERLRLFLIAWSLLLLGVGSVSFRFRDPYAAIPIAMIAGYALSEILRKKPGKGGMMKIRAIVSLLLIAGIVQALATAAFFIDHPSQEEMEALNWIKQNTPEDSIVLTWKEEGYYIIGVSDRKDILTWKKIYQGFFEEPPSVDEARAAYTDMFVMFRSANKDWMMKLLEGYSVDYIYIDARMRSELDALRYGLVEYLSYDTHFRPVFANDKAEIYKLEKERIEPENYTLELDSYMDFPSYEDQPDNILSLVPYAEGYWNGISYLDPRDFRAHYPDISEIAYMYLRLENMTGEEAYGERARWLVEWLEFEQQHDGSWMDQKYETPKKSAAVTCRVAYDMFRISEEFVYGKGKTFDSNETLANTYLLGWEASSFINDNYANGWVKTLETSEDDDYRTDAACLPAAAIVLENAEKESLLENILNAQNGDGSWDYGTFSDRSTVNSQAQILSDLIEYYEFTGDERVKPAIDKGARWLAGNQNSGGMFWNFVVESTGRVVRTERVAYPRAVKIYMFAGMQEQARKTEEYFRTAHEPGKNDLEMIVEMMRGSI